MHLGLSKYLKTSWLWIGLIFAAAVVLRLYQLGSLPIFTDEAIYMRWVQIGANDPAWRFIPLTDGKPPLYHWLVMLSYKLYPSLDLLIHGRFVSVVSGLISVGLIQIAAWSLFRSNRIALLAGSFMALSPMMVVHDRLAIVDSLLTTISIAVFIGAYWLLKANRLDVALISGLTGGLGLLTKSSGLLFILLMPLHLLLKFDWPPPKLTSLIKSYLPKFGLWVLVVVLAQIVGSILRLSELYYRIGQKNHEFILTFSQFMSDPGQLFWGNARSLIGWQVGYLTFPVVILVLLSLYFYRKSWRKISLLWLYWLLPMLAIAAFNKIIFARFLLFSTPFLLILSAYSFDQVLKLVKQPTQVRLLILTVLAIQLSYSAWFVIEPETAPIPDSDKNQYVIGQASGIGVHQMVDYLQQQSANQTIFLGTDGTFGLTPDAFQVYLSGNPNISIDGYYPVSRVPDEVAAQVEYFDQVYFIYYNVQDIPDQDNIELIQEYPKTDTYDKTNYLRLYRVVSP